MNKTCEHCGVVHRYWWDCEWQRKTSAYGFVMGGDINPAGSRLATSPLERIGARELGQGGYWNAKRRGEDLRKPNEDEAPREAERI